MYHLIIQGRSHIVAWGGRGPCKIFFFPLDYEEKIIRPPQHYTAGPFTHFSQILPALNKNLETPSIFLKKIICSTFKPKKKKKTQKKFELKSEKK